MMVHLLPQSLHRTRNRLSAFLFVFSRWNGPCPLSNSSFFQVCSFNCKILMKNENALSDHIFRFSLYHLLMGLSVSYYGLYSAHTNLGWTRDLSGIWMWNGSEVMKTVGLLNFSSKCLVSTAVLPFKKSYCCKHSVYIGISSANIEVKVDSRLMSSASMSVLSANKEEVLSRSLVASPCCRLYRNLLKKKKKPCRCFLFPQRCSLRTTPQRPFRKICFREAVCQDLHQKNTTGYPQIFCINAQRKVCVRLLPVEKSHPLTPLTMFRGLVWLRPTHPAVIYILQRDCCDKNIIACVCPERPEFNVKHISRPANRQWEPIWTYFTHDVKPLGEEEEEEETAG